MNTDYQDRAKENDDLCSSAKICVLLNLPQIIKVVFYGHKED